MQIFKKFNCKMKVYSMKARLMKCRNYLMVLVEVLIKEDVFMKVNGKMALKRGTQDILILIQLFIQAFGEIILKMDMVNMYFLIVKYLMGYGKMINIKVHDLIYLIYYI